ncbi:hypothetical protein [Streptomyces sp. NPDC002644]
MSFRVIPGEGLDVARFGESRSELRKRLGKCHSFRRSDTGPLTDHYVQFGLLLDFEESDRLELIEVTSNAGVTVGGVPLFGRDYRQVIDDLSRIGFVGTEDASGIEFPKGCFALFNSAPEEEGSEVEGVTIFVPGYYG